MTADVPVVEAHRQRDQLVFHCEYCRRNHYHGLGDGHRQAHCFDAFSPYLQTGYVLRERT